MRLHCFLILGLLACLVFLPAQAEAFILINEILADPPAGLAGDANNDGVGSTTQDEFVELFNSTSDTFDISGWSLSDAVKARHTFASGSIFQPQGLLVVFGGGNPNLLNLSWQLASTGTLSLNNDKDTVTLLNQKGEVIDQVTYGSEAGQDQSLVRSPEGGANNFIQHLSLPNANGQRFSPGYFINPIIVTEPSANDSPDQGAESETGKGNSAEGDNPNIPEPATICYLTLGLGSMLFRRRKQPTILPA